MEIHEQAFQIEEAHSWHHKSQPQTHFLVLRGQSHFLFENKRTV